MLDQFRALISQYYYLRDDIDNIREDAHGNIIYTYNGIMDCAVILDGSEFGDWGDTCAAEIESWSKGLSSTDRCRWYSTLEELVATIAQEADPDFSG